MHHLYKKNPQHFRSNSKNHGAKPANTELTGKDQNDSIQAAQLIFRKYSDSLTDDITDYGALTTQNQGNNSNRKPESLFVKNLTSKEKSTQFVKVLNPAGPNDINNQKSTKRIPPILDFDIPESLRLDSSSYSETNSIAKVAAALANTHVSNANDNKLPQIQGNHYTQVTYPSKINKDLKPIVGKEIMIEHSQINKINTKSQYVPLEVPTLKNKEMITNNDNSDYFISQKSLISSLTQTDGKCFSKNLLSLDSENKDEPATNQFVGNNNNFQQRAPSSSSLDKLYHLASKRNNSDTLIACSFQRGIRGNDKEFDWNDINMVNLRNLKSNLESDKDENSSEFSETNLSDINYNSGEETVNIYKQSASAYNNTYPSSSLSLPLKFLPNIDSNQVQQGTSTYEMLNNISGNQIRYEGTLPDLIPNHYRKNKMDKIKNKLFRTHSTHKSVPLTSSIAENKNGHAIVRTNHNMKFRSSMRDDAMNDLDLPRGQLKIGSHLSINEDLNNVFSSDEDGYSSESNDQKRLEKFKKKKKEEGITRGIKKKTLAHYRSYQSEITHNFSAHNSHTTHTNKFNEDKPWKSHKDINFLTLQERKRYEAMWVSNRYLYLSLLPWWSRMIDGENVEVINLPDDGLMLNLVVLDIWTRSNLPTGLLKQIYHAVDTRDDGTLDRTSFIVGMWLVDQCLYGRKLPKKVDQIVWDSADKYIVNILNNNTLKVMNKQKQKKYKTEMKSIKKVIKKSTHF